MSSSFYEKARSTADQATGSLWSLITGEPSTALLVVNWNDDESSLDVSMQQPWKANTHLGDIPPNAKEDDVKAALRECATKAQDQLEKQGKTRKVLTDDIFKDGIQAVMALLEAKQGDAKQG
jgi:hypothetical protein